MICPDQAEDREAEASAEAAHAEAAAARAEDLAAEARAEAEASAEDLEVTTDRRITDRPIFTALISAGAGTDRAITAAVAAAVSVRF